MQNRMVKYLLVTLFAVGALSTAHAQKIGFADLELILAFMPEAKVVDQELNTYQQQLAKNLQVKRDYFETRLAEFQERAAEAGDNLPESELAAMQAELEKLQNELAKSQQDAEQRFIARRAERLSPVLNKVQAAIDSLAKEQGFTYIFNTSSSGTSIVLFGGEEHNLTKTLMERLGIPIPAELSEN